MMFMAHGNFQECTHCYPHVQFINSESETPKTSSLLDEAFCVSAMIVFTVC